MVLVGEMVVWDVGGWMVVLVGDGVWGGWIVVYGVGG